MEPTQLAVSNGDDASMQHGGGLGISCFYVKPCLSRVSRSFGRASPRAIELWQAVAQLRGYSEADECSDEFFSRGHGYCVFLILQRSDVVFEEVS